MMMLTSARLVPMISLREVSGSSARANARRVEQRQRLVEDAPLRQGDGDAVHGASGLAKEPILPDRRDSL